MAISGIIYVLLHGLVLNGIFRGGRSQTRTGKPQIVRTYFKLSQIICHEQLKTRAQTLVNSLLPI